MNHHCVLRIVQPGNRLLLGIFPNYMTRNVSLDPYIHRWNYAILYVGSFPVPPAAMGKVQLLFYQL